MKYADFETYFDKEFGKAILEIDMKSSPGLCCFTHLGSTNGDIFKYDNGVFDEERLALVKYAVKHRLQALVNKVAEADNINVFIKPEPHSDKKLAEGRYRLISAVSLIDTLVDRVLFGWLQRKALTCVGSTPCLVGWTPLLGGWRYMRARFVGKQTACLDKSSWDWTVQEEVVTLWFKFVTSIAVRAPQWWLTAVASRFDMLFNRAVFQFKDGATVKQRYPGIMKSGCFLTLILNSVGQSMMHYLAMLKLGKDPVLRQPVCVGDDTVQEVFEGFDDYVAIMKSYGAQVKEYKVRNWVEFCGFSFTKQTCIPNYWRKHLFKLQYVELVDTLKSYQVLYANEPRMLTLLRDLAAEVDPALVLSQVEVSEIFNAW